MTEKPYSPYAKNSKGMEKIKEVYSNLINQDYKFETNISNKLTKRRRGPRGT